MLHWRQGLCCWSRLCLSWPGGGCWQCGRGRCCCSEQKPGWNCSDVSMSELLKLQEDQAVVHPAQCVTVGSGESCRRHEGPIPAPVESSRRVRLVGRTKTTGMTSPGGRESCGVRRGAREGRGRGENPGSSCRCQPARALPRPCPGNSTFPAVQRSPGGARRAVLQELLRQVRVPPSSPSGHLHQGSSRRSNSKAQLITTITIRSNIPPS